MMSKKIAAVCTSILVTTLALGVGAGTASAEDGVPVSNPSGALWTIDLESNRPIYPVDYDKVSEAVNSRLSAYLSIGQRTQLNAKIDAILKTFPKVSPLSQEHISSIFCEEVDESGNGSFQAFFRNSCKKISGKRIKLLGEPTFAKEDFTEGYQEIFSLYKNTTSVDDFMRSVYLEIAELALKTNALDATELVNTIELGFSDPLWTQYLEGKFRGPLRIKTCSIPNAVQYVKTRFGDRSTGLQRDLIRGCGGIGIGAILDRSSFSAQIGTFSFAMNYLFVETSTYATPPSDDPDRLQRSYLVSAYKATFTSVLSPKWSFWPELFAATNPNEIRSPLFWNQVIRVRK
jgi:hypothetical protein